MRVPHAEQLGRTITALGGPARIVAIMSPNAKQAEVAFASKAGRTTKCSYMNV